MPDSCLTLICLCMLTSTKGKQAKAESLCRYHGCAVTALLQEKAAARCFSASGSFKEIVSKYVKAGKLSAVWEKEISDIWLHSSLLLLFPKLLLCSAGENKAGCVVRLWWARGEHELWFFSGNWCKSCQLELGCSKPLPLVFQAVELSWAMW